MLTMSRYRSLLLNQLDVDANNFLIATGITDATIKSAIFELVKDLKDYSIWSKMKAVYPFVGGTATTHKFNLVNPVDSNGAFRLSFNGGLTHSSNGVLPNGANGFANTFVTPSTNLSQNSTHASIYSRTNNTGLAERLEMGSSNGTIDFQQVIRWNGTLGNLSRLNNSFGSNGYVATKTSGYYITSRTASNITKKYEDGVLRETNADVSSTPNSFNITIGGRNNSGTVLFFDNKQYAFATIGDGLTDEDSANLYYSVQKFQTTLGRQVGTPIYSSNATDVNARLFLGATNIQDATITSAVDTLVQGLKTDGIWTKMKAIYPFVGGTATTHKFNLANALDDDTAFRMTFLGGWTHSSTGATPNGTNGYADTFLNPATNLATNNASLGYYGGNVVSASNATAMGSLLSAPFRVFAIAPALSGFGLFGDVNDGSGTFTANNRQDGFIFASRNNSANKIHSIRGVQTLKTEASTSAPSVVSVIGARRFNTAIDSYCNFNFRFAFMGDGLTSTEATNLHTRVQAFQTTLNRQV